MPALSRREKVKCEKCGDEYRRSDSARHPNRCGYKDEHKRPIYNVLSNRKREMEYRVAKKRSQPSSKQSTVCPFCD